MRIHQLVSWLIAGMFCLAIIPPANAGFECKLEGGQLTCGQTKAKAKEPDNQGERACPPGYVVLEKANKYGAFCEPREGLPAPQAAEPEKCKFPGEVGTPPNCSCPNGTEFLGYKGCVAFTYQEAYCINPSVPGGGFNTRASEDLAKQCKAEGGYGECKTQTSCCCKKKVYAQ